MGVIFFCFVTRRYPRLATANDASRAIMEESPCCRCPCGAACFQAYFCYPGMIAHVLDKTGVCNYWCALLCSLCFPWCTTCCAVSCLDMETKLGGTQKGCCTGALEACFCACCLAAQASEALDKATDAWAAK